MSKKYVSKVVNNDDEDDFIDELIQESGYVEIPALASPDLLSTPPVLKTKPIPSIPAFKKKYEEIVAKKSNVQQSHVNGYAGSGIDENGYSYSADLGVKKKKKAAVPNVWDAYPVDKVYSPDVVHERVLSKPATPSEEEDISDIKDSLEILQSTDRTLVFLIAIDKNDERNSFAAIKCNGSTTFGGYAYDRSRDSYIVRCSGFLQVGQIPFSYVMSMKNVGNWSVKVPIPQNVLEKYLTPEQRKIITSYKDQFPEHRFKHEYIQMLGCN
jgi:hypothetical protein